MIGSHMRREEHVTVQTRGGLGNQLFQFALGLQLSYLRSCSLNLDIGWHRLRGSRPFELSEVRMPSSVTLVEQLGPFSDAVARVRAKLPAKFQFWSLRANGLTVEKTLAFDSDVLLAQPGTTLRGYFQSWKYFTSVTAQVREVTRSQTHPSKWFEDQRRWLSSLGPWIGVHVRRGDYVSTPYRSSHGLMDVEYYKEAYSIVRDAIGDLPVVVFSDDELGARRLLEKVFGNAIWFRAPEGSSPLENLLLMSTASHLITANSTFSWWAGWITDNPGRLVVAPTPWLAHDPSLGPDLIPPRWLQVPTRAGR